MWPLVSKSRGFSGLGFLTYWKASMRYFEGCIVFLHGLILPKKEWLYIEGVRIVGNKRTYSWLYTETPRSLSLVPEGTPPATVFLLTGAVSAPSCTLHSLGSYKLSSWYSVRLCSQARWPREWNLSKCEVGSTPEAPVEAEWAQGGKRRDKPRAMG